MLSLLLLAVAAGPAGDDGGMPDMGRIAARINAQNELDKCAQDWAEHFVQERETADVIADSALRYCARPREAFVAATNASISDAAAANEWVTGRIADIRRRVVDFVLLMRSDIPTGIDFATLPRAK